MEHLIGFDLDDHVYLLQNLYELNKHQTNRIKKLVNLCISII